MSIIPELTAESIHDDEAKAAMARRARKVGSLKKLSDLEVEVMGVVWELGECSSTEVIETYCKRRRLAPTTIRTVLSNIEKKGYLTRVASFERGHRFRPAVKREDVAGHSLKRVIANLFDDSPRLAVAYLLKDERLADEDLQEIRRLLEAAEESDGSGEAT